MTIAASSATSAATWLAFNAASETVSASIAPVRSGVKSHADAAAAAQHVWLRTGDRCCVIGVGKVNEATGEESTSAVAISAIRCNLSDLLFANVCILLLSVSADDFMVRCIGWCDLLLREWYIFWLLCNLWLDLISLVCFIIIVKGAQVMIVKHSR